ncbi:unknown [Bacteroides sp. CAG:633]|nr:unknown [Bacteroides sp. CAG:633]
MQSRTVAAAPVSQRRKRRWRCACAKILSSRIFQLFSAEYFPRGERVERARRSSRLSNGSFILFFLFAYKDSGCVRIPYCRSDFFFVYLKKPFFLCLLPFGRGVFFPSVISFLWASALSSVAYFSPLCLSEYIPAAGCLACLSVRDRF